MLKETDIFIHFASSDVKKFDNKESYETNFFKSKKILDKAVKNKCRKWLIVSTSSEFGVRSNKIKKIDVNSNRLPYSDYGMSKAMFTDYCIKLAEKTKSKCRIMRLFPFYGKAEASKRFYPSLLKSISNRKNFTINNPGEVRTFSDVKYISKILADSLNFKKKSFKTYQIWNVSEYKVFSVKDFASKLWKIKKAKGKLLYKNKKNFFTHIPAKNSLWELNE